MPTSTSLRICETLNEETSVTETDFTITKTQDGHSFNWAKFEFDGVAGDGSEAMIVILFNDESWNNSTADFAMTITTTAEGTWSMPFSSGTYTVDEKNSKVTFKTLTVSGEPLQKPEIMEATYSNIGKTLVIVRDKSSDEETNNKTLTFTPM